MPPFNVLPFAVWMTNIKYLTANKLLVIYWRFFSIFYSLFVLSLFSFFFAFFHIHDFFLKCSKKWKMITKKNTYPTKWFSSSVNNLDEISLTFYCWYRKILRSSTCSKHRIYGWRNFFSLLFICIKLLLIYQNGSIWIFRNKKLLNSKKNIWK